jgi:uncharacterized protein YecT (DUF1311 family)
MKIMAGVLAACACLALTESAAAGALEECMIRGDHAMVSRCLVDLDRETQASLIKAEGDAGKRARDLDTATGRPSAAPALAKSMRAFTDYRKTQCDFVRAMHATSLSADHGQLGCVIDLTRRRIRELQT